MIFNEDCLNIIFLSHGKCSFMPSQLKLSFRLYLMFLPVRSCSFLFVPVRFVPVRSCSVRSCSVRSCSVRSCNIDYNIDYNKDFPSVIRAGRAGRAVIRASRAGQFLLFFCFFRFLLVRPGSRAQCRLPGTQAGKKKKHVLIFCIFFDKFRFKPSF